MLLSRHREHVVHLVSCVTKGQEPCRVAPAKSGRKPAGRPDLRSAAARSHARPRHEQPPQGHSRVPTVTLSRNVVRLCAAFVSVSAHLAARPFTRRSPRATGVRRPGLRQHAPQREHDSTPPRRLPARRLAHAARSAARRADRLEPVLRRQPLGGDARRVAPREAGAADRRPRRAAVAHCIPSSER